jgi:hypothetical protein
MKAVDAKGNVFELETDHTWKGNLSEFEGWETLEYDDSEWNPVNVKGKANAEPWGDEFLKNLGGSTTPYRPLSVNLSSPYIRVFDEMPDIVYDVKRASIERIGWYRFDAPPGVKEIVLHNNNLTLWINGKEVPVRAGMAVLDNPPKGVSKVAIRVKMKPGQYAGAAFDQPIQLKFEGGIIQAGLWSNFALPTYSGIGVYKQHLDLNPEEANRQVELDLGQVLVAAEVLVNGQRAGVKVAAPYKFDLTGLVQSGSNEIEIRVANTLAPHYTVPRQAKDLGPVDSGLVGPVKLKILNDK